jgi:hypothetical protein
MTKGITIIFCVFTSTNSCGLIMYTNNQTISLKSKYLKYHSLKVLDAIYEHCKQNHTNNETQFGEHYKPIKNTFDHQRPSNQ